MQWKNLIVLSLSFSIIFLTTCIEKVYAYSSSNSNIHTLIIYSKENNDQDQVIYQLDQLVSHFSESVKIVSDSKVPSLNTFDYVFYVGLEEKNLVASLIKSINDYSGKIFFMGCNMEQFRDRMKIKTDKRMKIKEVSFANGSAKQAFVSFNEIFTITSNKSDLEIFIEGWRGNESYPLLVSNGDDYYFATDDIDELLINYLSQSLFHFFNEQQQVNKMSFIKIDYINPATNLKILTQLTSYLSSQQIPLVFALSPIYKNNESGKVLHFSDSPQLMKKLQALQKKGASILLSYPEFSGQMSSDEKKVIVEQQIQELAVYQLFPVAVSFPNNQPISEEDLMISSSYFKSIFSASNRLNPVKLKQTPPLITKPSYLDGATWFPETLGEIDQFNPTSLLNLKRKLNELEIMDGCVIGISFPAFLELDLLKQVVPIINSISGKQWMNLKDWEHSVNVPYITIQTNKEGIIVVNNDLPFIREFMYKQQLSFLELALWIIAIVVTLFIIAFTTYTFYLKLRLRKSLFLERNRNGQ